jgi:hypothetical protein
LAARRLLFFALSALLVGSAFFVLFVSGHGAAPRADGSVGRSQARSGARIFGARLPRSGSRPSGASARLPVRRFVEAFLRFEVGNRRPTVVGAIRRTSTPRFGAELLEGPVGLPVTGAEKAAVISRLEVRTVATSPPVALASGVASRPGGPEEFAFLFVHTGSGWLASGPGE